MPYMLKRKQRGAAPQQLIQPAEFGRELNFARVLNNAIRKRKLHRFVLFPGLDYLCSNSSDDCFSSRNEKTCHNDIPPEFYNCPYAKKEGVLLLFRGTVYLPVYTLSVCYGYESQPTLRRLRPASCGNTFILQAWNSAVKPPGNRNSILRILVEYWPALPERRRSAARSKNQ